MGTIRRKVSDRIKYLRNARKMTQAELANAIGLTQGCITNYEAGIREPDLDTLYAIAKALYVPLSAFFDDYSITYIDQADIDRLNILNHNQRLSNLFDKIKHLSESDFNLVSQIINRIHH